MIRDGKLVAFDTIEGLRKSTGTTGPLDEVFAGLVHPKTTENLERYFEGGSQ